MRRRDTVESTANSPGKKPRALFQSVEMSGCALIRAREPTRSLKSAPFHPPRPTSVHHGQIHIARYGPHIGLWCACLTFHQFLQGGGLEGSTFPVEESGTVNVSRN